MNPTHHEETLLEALDRLKEQGYKDDFMVDGDFLKDRATGARYAPETLVIDETARFEGDSNPDDAAIVLALRAGDGGPKGTLITSYGARVSVADTKMINRLRPAPAA
jgi:hypothetical protein